ncbi:MAG: hypothetical protein H0V00_12925 [Chloroflexia bacterium]|nr:hypothetical protein [Chloroflexia bacterium]
MQQFIDPKGSFLKNLALSVLLLGLSSFLIPIVLKQIDDRKFVDQQRFQAELSRQGKIIDAQAALLDTMASDFWDYEGYAADVLYSRDERFGRDDWHERAVDAYYEQSGPLLGKMRADISTMLRLALRPTYESFLRLYEEEVLAFDSCLLELMKLELMKTDGSPQPSRCVASEGKFAGASWDTLTAYVLQQDLAEKDDLEFESLAKAFGLHDAPD